jgi:arsenite methyltransferase
MNKHLNSKRPDYGIDAPAVCLGMFLIAGIGAILTITCSILLRNTALKLPGIAVGVLASAYGTGMGTYMVWSSRIGKLRTRERLLESVNFMRPWRGNEVVLDVGCGRGLMLVGAARRLSSGVAIGLDIWRSEDQAHNTPEATLEIASLEGVRDRIRVGTSDARQLPIPDCSIDVVTSHWVVHNLPTPQDRILVLNEMWRVLRPGGVIVLADIAHIAEYASHLESLGASEISLDEGGWNAYMMGILSGGSFRPQSLLAQRAIV